MSYLTENVNGKTLNSFNLADLNDIDSTSLEAGSCLQFDSTSSNWKTNQLTDSAHAFSIFSQDGASWQTSTGAGYSYNSDSSATPPTEIGQTGYSISGIRQSDGQSVSQYNWASHLWWYNPSVPRFSGIYVPAGTWYVRSSFGGRPNSAANYAQVRFATGPGSGSGPTTATLTPFGPSFYVAPSAGRFCQMPTAIKTTSTASTLICLEFINGSGYQYGGANNWLKYFTFHALKIG